MPFVLDASVTLTWAFEDEVTPYTDRVLGRLDHDTALVPAIWPLEIANGALAGERRQRIQPADTSRFSALVQSLPIELDDMHLERAVGLVLDLARAHTLTTYDASYLELAMRAGLPLATQDERLRAAADQVGVPLAQ
jgi:predicted nucleic acid-binding protein